MATTVNGGATKDAAGTWRNADGKELDRAQVAEVEALHAELADERRQAEAQRAAQELASDPATRAALRAIGAVQQPRAEPVKK